jgi:flagellar hook protein FlgE
MIGSLYSGISGLKANTSAMGVIGDNIANVETTGFKSSSVSFANIFSSTMSQNSLQIGRGVTLNSVTPDWANGSLENTNSPTDLSINGTGLFMVSDPSTNNTYYTRAGNFDWNKDGNLVTPDGFVAQGYSIATDGTVGAVGDIAKPTGTSAPQATSNMSFGMNLNGAAAVGDTFDSSLTTYDSLGSQQILDFKFTNTGAGTWSWSVTPSDSASTVTTSSNTLSFDANGVLSSPTTNPTIAVTGLSDGAGPMNITWNMVDAAGASDGSVTGYTADSAKTAQNQDGYPSGSLQSVSVDEDGVFTGVYSNGSMIPFARVALADFPCYSGLAKQGSNLYAQSLSSGQPLVGPPNSTGMGSISPSTLEKSNVDLGTEFVNMITTQRAFEANSKVITTSDTILSDLVNIIR